MKKLSKSAMKKIMGALSPQESCGGCYVSPTSSIIVPCVSTTYTSPFPPFGIPYCECPAPYGTICLPYEPIIDP